MSKLGLRPVMLSAAPDPVSPDIPYHPDANIFPLMVGREFDELVQSIRERGQKKPIVLHIGKILDGRNRYLACLAAGVMPRFTVFGWPEGYPCPSTVIIAALEGRPLSRSACRALPAPLNDNDGSFTVDGLPGDTLAFVLDENLHRRQLDESQRAMAAARASNLRHGRPKAVEKGANLPLSSQPLTVSDAAEKLNVSERSVKSARKVIEEGTPELQKAVEAGEVAVSRAAVIAALPAEEQRDVLAQGALKVRKAHVWERAKHEWYVEPRLCTKALLEAEDFPGTIVDPSCGQGHIVLECRAAGLEAYGMDIVDRTGGAEWFKAVHDFLGDVDIDYAPLVSYINNPPYNKAEGTEAFTRKALSLATGKVAVFTEVRFLASKRRAKGLFREFPPHDVYLCLPRPSCPPGEYLLAGNKAQGGTADWIWIVWDMRCAPPEHPRWHWLIMDGDDDE